MSGNYFKNLSRKARKIDEGLDKLSQTWQVPQALVGGYVEVTEETETCLETLRNNIKTLQNQIHDTQTNAELMHKAIDLDNVLEQSRIEYENLKEQVDNLEDVFSEYGYVHKKQDSTLKPVEKSAMSTQDSRIELSPDSSWRHKKMSNGSTTPGSTFLDVPKMLPKGIATPVIKSLASVLETYTPNEPRSQSTFFSTTKCDSMPKTLRENMYTPRISQPVRIKDINQLK